MFGVTVIIIHCTFSNAIVIEEYSLSCECLERLDLGLNNGWVSFTARFIKLYCFVSISEEDESLENSYGARSLTGAERASKFRAAHHTTADLRKLADKNNYNAQTPSSPYPTLRRPIRGPSAGRAVNASGITKNLRRLTSVAEKIDFLR